MKDNVRYCRNYTMIKIKDEILKRSTPLPAHYINIFVEDSRTTVCLWKTEGTSIQAYMGF